jgi:hypothetical protein
MLAPKFEPAGLPPKGLPDHHFRERHICTKVARAPYRLCPSFWRNVSEHSVSPSTMLRMVPLPETSSGRMERSA